MSQAEIRRMVRQLRSGTGDERAEALNAIGYLSSTGEPAAQMRLVQAGVIPPLVELLKARGDPIRILAVGAISFLARNDDIVGLFGAAEVVPPLIDFLKTAEGPVKSVAALAMLGLAGDHDICLGLARGGAIPLLMDLMNNGDELGKVNASGTIAQLAAQSEIRPLLMEAGMVLRWIETLKSGPSEGKISAALGLQDLVLGTEDKNQFVRAGVIPPLMELLKNGDERGTTSALGVMGRLSLHHKHIEALFVQAGVIPPVVRLLEKGSKKEKTDAAATVMLLSEVDQNRDLLVQAGVVPPLIRVLKKGPAEGREKAVAAVALLSLSSDIKALLVQSGVIPAVVVAMKKGDETTKDFAADAVFELANVEGNMPLLVQAGVVPLLADLMKNGTEDAKEAAAGTIANLAIAGVGHPEAALVKPSKEVLVPLIGLLKTGTALAKERAAAAIKYLASDEAAIQMVMLDVVPPLVALLKSGSDDAKRYAAGAIWDLTERETIKDKFIRAGVIPPLLQLLEAGAGDEDASKNAQLLRKISATSNEEAIAVLLKTNAIRVLLQHLSLEGCRFAVYNLSVLHKAVIEALKEAGAVAIVSSYVEKHPDDLTPVLILANLVGAADDGDISRDVLERVKRATIEFLTDGDGGDDDDNPGKGIWNIEMLLTALDNLAAKDANQPLLATEALISELKKVVANPSSSANAVSVALRVLCKLAFVKESHAYFEADDGLAIFKRVVEEYTSTGTTAGKGAREVSSALGILNLLGAVESRAGLPVVVLPPSWSSRFNLNLPPITFTK